MASIRPPFNLNASHVPALRTVTRSGDLDRVLSLPRRPLLDLNSLEAEQLVDKWTARLARKTTKCECAALGWPCITRLRPAQAWALEEAEQVGGVLGPIGVGHGKTGLDLLVPLAVRGCKLAVLLVPPELRGQIVTAYKLWSQHFRVPSIRVGSKFGCIQPGQPSLHVIAYSELSRAESTTLLESLRPDVIIADEGHKLRNKDTTRTGRFLRYLAQHNARFFTWSGTLFGSSVKHGAHLSAFALREGSPFPLDPDVVDEWSAAIDPSDNPAPLGPLQRLLAATGEGEIERALHVRIVESPGVVSTKEGAIDASILIDERSVTVPVGIGEALANLRKTWVRPDGEELVDALELARVAREMAAGFYYRWIFPKGEPDSLIEAWFQARKAWHKEVREKLKRREPHLDSPLLLAKAAARYHLGEPSDLPTWASDSYLDWIEIRDSVYHESEAVWIDDYLAQDAAKWACENRGIVWYQHGAFGQRVAELAKIPLHGGGVGAEDRILAERGDRSIVASIKSHGTGRDGLQRFFCEQLVANPPSSGSDWEQLLGRLHRIGQPRDEVVTLAYRHTPEYTDAIDNAIKQARWVQGVGGNLQKLCTASVIFLTP